MSVFSALRHYLPCCDVEEGGWGGEKDNESAEDRQREDDERGEEGMGEREVVRCS